MELPEKIGKYDVRSLLGRGAMGVVYKCHDPAIDREVAVKAITKSSMDPEELQHAIARFRHEARAVGRLVHPNIVQIFDYAEDDELAYIVMELVKGRTLLDYQKSGHNYSVKEAGGIIRQLLEGIGHAHKQGVVHRDMKPSNILLNEQDAVKIADFGIARTEASALTGAGDVVGTLYYMSPEQFMGEDVTPAADLYSIGVIAYELLTGRRPFQGSKVQIMQKVLNDIPENPSMLNLRLSPAVDRVLQRALAKAPKARYQEADVFAKELMYAIDGATSIGARSRQQPGRAASAPKVGSAGGAVPATGQAAGGEWVFDGNATPYTTGGAAAAGTPTGEQLSARQTEPAPVVDTTSQKAVLEAARLLTMGDVAPAASTPGTTTRDGGGNVDMTFPTMDTTLSSISLDTSVRKGRLLFVDDEQRILSAMKSLFRDRYHVFTTTDCTKALDFVSKYSMHVIISDQRMPEMQGVEFLRRSREISPNAVRILLTGYSDLAAIVGSINDGEVYRFISKPWDNNELRTIIGEAVTIGLELADTKSVDSELPPKIDAGVMVVDRTEDMYRVVTELMSKTCPVMHAKNIDSAVDIVRDKEVGLVIADADMEPDQMRSMLKLLKQENPQILTIVVTSVSDSEHVIELINQAQVFRFLNKPINVTLMRNHIQAALKRYLAFARSPELTQAQQVQVVEEVRETAFGQNLVNKMSNARQRWRERAAAEARRRAGMVQ